ncbi:MAG: hypothetical protein R3C10_27160 [Pirellulales bacterium]
MRRTAPDDVIQPGRATAVAAAAVCLVLCGTNARADDAPADAAVEVSAEEATAGKEAARLEEATLRQQVAVLDRAVEQDPDNAELYDRRGAARFKLNDIAGSLADFDRAIEIDPARAAGHWMRGITLYYAGRYAEGAAQFDAYQAVSTNDVENSVWWYICAARDMGHDKARAGLLPVGFDRRVPLMEVFALFQGKGTPADVLAAIERGQPSDEESRSRRFYGHLYLALYYDALGDAARARHHIDRAAGPDYLPGYMGDVARIHARRMAEADGAAEKTTNSASEQDR